MIINREKAKKTFDEYVSSYNLKDTKIYLKYVHTLKVCEICDEIAASLNMEGLDRDLAWLLGLLHDVGRFEQVRQYGTFNDAQSVEHASMSADILFRDGGILSYIDVDQTDDTDRSNLYLLDRAIRLHSMYRLPDTLTERERCYCNLLRDADKVDIIRVNVELPLNEVYNCTIEELENSVITKEVMESFREHHATKRSLKKVPIDHIASHISLAFELVYKRSFELVMEQGCLQKLMDFQSKNPETVNQLKELKSMMERYIEDRVKMSGTE